MDKENGCTITSSREESIFLENHALFPTFARTRVCDLSPVVISLRLLIILNARLAYSGVREATIQGERVVKEHPSAVNRLRELHFTGSKEFYGYRCAAGSDNGGKPEEDSQAGRILRCFIRRGSSPLSNLFILTSELSSNNPGTLWKM